MAVFTFNNSYEKVRSYLLGRWLPCLMFFVIVVAGAKADASSAVFEKVVPTEDQFLLLDIKTAKLLVLEGAVAYGFDRQVLLPVASLLQSLEMNVKVSATQGTLSFVNGSQSYQIDLNNDNKFALLPDIEAPIYWTNQESELLVSHLLVEALIEAKFEFDLSQLIGLIKQRAKPFPVEQRLVREIKRRDSPVVSNTDEAKWPQRVPADEFILDTYPFIGAPQANIALSLRSRGNEQGISGQNSLDYSGSIQTTSDLFYHYTRLTLNKNSDDELNSNLRFTRHQSSPYEHLFLGMNQYSFGDVAGKANNLSANNQSGVGLSFSRRPLDHSGKFATVTLEGFAQPGWEIDIYRGGVLLQSGTVPDDGRYVIADVQTLYGINRFEIKLYGPFGETDVHHKNIRINKSQLKHRQHGFDGYMLDSNNKLLSDSGEEQRFKADTFGFSYDYGLLPALTLGWSLSQKESEAKVKQQFIGANLQTSVTGALFNLSLSHQFKQGYAGVASVVGLLGQNTTYQLAYENNNNHAQQGSNVITEKYSGGINSSLNQIFISTSASFERGDNRDNLNLYNRIATSAAKLSLSHVIQYNLLSNNYNQQSTVFESLTGEISAAGRLAKNSRISAAVIYDLKNNAEIRRVRLSGSLRLTEDVRWSGQVRYIIDRDNDWQVSSAFSWMTDNMTLHSTMRYDAEESWSVNFGVKFSLGYDHHHKDWIVSGTSIIDSGILDINTYLDQNNNQQLDEGDVALQGVEFGHARQWEGIRSADNGQAILPFVTPFRATNFTPYWVTGVSPSTKSYAVYTHPGGRIKATIPFTVKTTVIGFALYGGEEGEPLISTEIQLLNPQGEVVNVIDTDLDGYFEFIDIEPGQYQVMINETSLADAALQSNPGKLAFTTPPAGGFFELSPILAIPLSESVTELVKVVMPNSENYDPIYEVEQLLRRVNNNELSDDSETETKSAKKGTSEDEYLEGSILEADGILQRAQVMVPTSQKAPSIELKQATLKRAQVMIPTSQQAPSTELKQATMVVPVSQVSIAALSAPANSFALQFGAFQLEYITKALIDSLLNEGIKAVSYFDETSKVFQVLTGPFVNRGEASEKSLEFKNRGFDNFIRNWPKIQSNPAETRLVTDDNGPRLLEQGYTIQLMGARNQKSIDDAINGEVLGPDVFQIKKNYQGKPFFVLLKGQYENAKLAQEGVASLPEQWRSNTWVRPLSNLRQGD
jgi:septal ring-binding cell division protein DamX